MFAKPQLLQVLYRHHRAKSQSVTVSISFTIHTQHNHPKAILHPPILLRPPANFSLHAIPKAATNNQSTTFTHNDSKQGSIHQFGLLEHVQPLIILTTMFAVTMPDSYLCQHRLCRHLRQLHCKSRRLPWRWLHFQPFTGLHFCGLMLHLGRLLRSSILGHRCFRSATGTHFRFWNESSVRLAGAGCFLCFTALLSWCTWRWLRLTAGWALLPRRRFRLASRRSFWLSPPSLFLFNMPQ